VQSWVNGSASNYGALFKQQSPENINNVIQFDSSSWSDATQLPKLTVTYTEPTPPTLQGIGERRFYTYESQRINDRMEAKANNANGNLLLYGGDLKVKGHRARLVVRPLLQLARHYV
jgi:hypothetical protein